MKLKIRSALDILVDSYHNHLKFISDPNRSDLEREEYLELRVNISREFERLQEIEKLSKQLLKKIPEYMIFGTWDTKRCVVCKGWLKDPAGRSQTYGHKDNCARAKLEKILNDIT